MTSQANHFDESICRDRKAHHYVVKHFFSHRDDWGQKDYEIFRQCLDCGDWMHADDIERSEVFQFFRDPTYRPSRKGLEIIGEHYLSQYIPKRI